MVLINNTVEEVVCSVQTLFDQQDTTLRWLSPASFIPCKHKQSTPQTQLQHSQRLRERLKLRQALRTLICMSAPQNIPAGMRATIKQTKLHVHKDAYAGSLD